MVHNQGIEPSPALLGQLHRLACDGRVRGVTCEHLDTVTAVLVVQLVEGIVGAGLHDEFGKREGEEVVSGCEANAWGMLVWTCGKFVEADKRRKYEMIEVSQSRRGS